MEAREREAIAQFLDEAYSSRRQFRDPIDESLKRISAFQAELGASKGASTAGKKIVSVKHLNQSYSETDLTVLRSVHGAE
jgi:hypothetical protein